MRRRNKDSNKAKIWMSVFIAFLMVMSVFGVIIGSQSNDIKYGKYKFTVQDNLYETKINGEPIQFYTLPSDASMVLIENSTIEKLKAASFIITTFDPKSNESLPAIEVTRFDFSRLLNGKIVYSAVLEPSETYASLPVFNCENASIQTPVLIFNVSDVMSVVDSGNCVYLNGKGNDFVRIRDRIIYGWYGVI